MKPFLHRSFIGLAMGISFLMPIYKQAIPILIILLIINWLWLIPQKPEYFHRFRIPFYLFVAFFLLHIIGIIYSDNVDNAVSDVVSKLSFLIFPLIFTFGPRLLGKHIKNVLLAFIAGCLLASFIDIGFFYYNMHIGKYSINYLFGDYFSVLMHLGYFAMYLNFAIIAAAYLWTKYRHEVRWIIWLMPVIMLFFAIIIVITTSKNGILMLLLTCIVLGAFYIVKSRRYITGVVSLIGILSLILAMAEAFPSVYVRFKSSINAFSSEEIDKLSTESTMLRRMAWESAGELIGKNFWIGAGTGDVKADLKEAYREAGYAEAYRKGINVHNQYLQVFVALGFFGVLLLISLLLIPFYLSVIHRNYLLSLFLLINIFAALTESIYEVQAGIVFFNFFMGILFFGTGNKLTVEAEERKY